MNGGPLSTPLPPPPGEFLLFVPDGPSLEPRTCWKITQGIGFADNLPARRFDGVPGCVLYDDLAQRPKIAHYTARALWDHLESRLPATDGREDAPGRQPDWVNFVASLGAREWCAPQRDLIYATLALLSMPEVHKMMDLAVCMFVARAEWTEAWEQQARQSEILGCLKKKVSPDTEELDAVNFLNGAQATHTVAAPPLYMIKVPRLLIPRGPPNVAEAMGQNMILFTTRDGSAALSAATELFIEGSSSGAEGPTDRTRVCAVMSMARLIFHELLHLCCVLAVPEHIPTASDTTDGFDPDCISEHGLQAPNPEWTCDIIDMVSTTFDYLLDQLVEPAGGPAWTEVDECRDMLVPQDLIAHPMGDPEEYEWAEFVAALPGQDDPCGDVPRPLELRLPAEVVEPEVVPERRVPDLGDTDSEHLPEVDPNDPMDVWGRWP
jgi:hypothetical protein